ncbi:hypothetical protein J6TS2_22620 [Heyndrickxia sporothermodurans]|nr:hypothetical protein J6TS2_22620 [Heyndrickxia sporothermodurans]
MYSIGTTSNSLILKVNELQAVNTSNSIFLIDFHELMPRFYQQKIGKSSAKINALLL